MVVRAKRLKDRTEKAISNGNSREILNWRYSKTKLWVEKRSCRKNEGTEGETFLL